MTINMASHSSGMEFLCSNKEMASESEELSDFMKTATLPVCVCIVRGKHLTSSVQLTKGDILFLKSCETKTVTLTHQDSSTGHRKQINVPLDFPYKFNVLPPKNVSDRTASIIMYPSVADLMMDSPTYFEATTNYDDPYLPGFSIHRGDKFKFRGLVTDPKDGRERLKVFDELENVLLLSLDCRANFFPLEDEDSYTLRQLIDFAPVPRRLKLAKNDLSDDSTASFKSNSGDSGFRDYFGGIEDEKDNDNISIHEKDLLEMINFTGVIHMLKPNLLISASPLNDTDTEWKIPLTADLCVREHNLDDYEVPSVLRNKEPALISALSPSQTPLTPTFPAPPTPPLPQPLVPVDVFNFTEIYGCPIKAKIMDLSKCDISLQTLLHGMEEISIYRLDKTKRLYAEDLKTNRIYSLSKDLKISFIEYPEKFYTISELLSLPLGTEITVLEDIASDFPRPILLQFGDLLRITTNTASTIKIKSSSTECKVLKCEKVNREGGSNVKMKLPLDFEVNMVLSIDPNSRRVIGLDDLLSGRDRLPDQEVAILIDNSEKMLQDLPVNLKLLKFMPERILVASPFVNQLPSSNSQAEITANGDWPSPTKEFLTHKNVGISLTSGLVLAFRERLDVYDINVIKSHSDAVQVPYEILSKEQYAERERLCKSWADEEDSDIHSTASDEKSSTIDSSSQASEPTRNMGKRTKSKKIDKIRRLSQVLNPKHWRPPKAAPEPLPHPEAMGLMALSMRPPSDQLNVYETKAREDDFENLKDPSSCEPHSSVSSEEDVYEAMEVGPLRQSPGTPPMEKKETKGFTHRFHKSMPLKQIVSKTYAKTRAKRKERSQAKQSVSSPTRERLETNLSLEDGVFENQGDDDPFYDAPEPLFHNSSDDRDKMSKADSPRKRDNVHQSDSPKTSTKSSGAHQNDSSLSLPPLPPRRSASSLSQQNNCATVSKSMDSLADQNESSKVMSVSKDIGKESQSKGKALEPPVPPRRKRIVKSFNDGDKNPTSDNTNPNTSQNSECKSEQKLIINSRDVEHPVSSLNHDSANSEVKNEDKVMDSKANLLNKPTAPQKMPVPKPRGLKKGKSPEIPPKISGGAKSECVKRVEGEAEVKRLGKTMDGDKNSDRIMHDMNSISSASTNRVETAVVSTDNVVLRKESVKPKPPPKPKPRLE